ncbi:conserved Plasmodium protein, unknown function, partial [Plasmodium ovale]
MWRLLLVYVSWCFPYCVLCPFHFCNYGEYFKNGACYGCEENSYSSYTNSEGCFGCPPSSSNNIRSSKFIYDCACDNDDYYLNYLGNRCDMCSDVSHRFFCGKNLNELHVDNIESFFKHKNEITFANFDRCLIKKDRKNMYPIMSNMFIYCKSPDICLDTCGRCSEYNEGFMCDRCTKQYAKNIFLKYAKCKRCYHVIFTIFTTLLYCFVVLILFILLVKCINVSLYFYHFDIYKKGTIYFVHYFREFAFYLSLLLLLSLSNDLTESERENYTAQERGNTEAAHQLQSGDIRTHYFLNIYLHNVFFDLIKSIQLNFMHFIKLDCLHLDISVSKVVATQTFVFAFGLCLLLCFTLLCNLVFLYLRRGNARLFGLPPNGNSLYRGITTADAEVTSGSANSVIGVGEPNRVSEWEERLRDKLSHPPLPLRLPLLLPPLLLPNFTRPSYVKVTFFYASEAVEFLKTWIQICYYQYIQIFLYVTNSLVIFIFLSSYVCIGLFNYKRSYYDTSALCSDNSNVGVSKYMGICTIFCVCFVFYIILIICIYSKPISLRRNYDYKYTYGLYTFLCKEDKPYYYIVRMLFTNFLFLIIILLPNHLSCLIYISFFFLSFICLTIFLDPYIKIDHYKLKTESFFFMFLFFFNIQLEQLRIVTYHITSRIMLSFFTVFIYSFILLYYLYFMLNDVYTYGYPYGQYLRYEKLRGLSAGKEGDSSEGTPQDRYYFYHYLKCKMNIVTRPIDEVERDISLLEDMEEVEPVRRMPGGDAEYIRQQCVLISPFVAETVIQLLFISKNINHMIRLKKRIPYIEIYNCLFENGYIEIQRTPIDRFLTKAIYIYKEVFKGNYKLFRTEMTRIFADIVRDVRCFKDVYMRECVASRIRGKYKINEIEKNTIIFDENYEQKHINTFLYNLRGLSKNVYLKNEAFFQLFP